MKTVLIIYKFLPQYRLDFFSKLKSSLLKDDIDLKVIYGKLKNNDSFKKDEVDFDEGIYIPNRTIKIGKTELVWQPCLSHIKNKDIIIVEQANKLLLNYFLMFSRHFYKFSFALWGHGRNMQENPNSLRNKFKYLFIRRCDWWFAYTKGVKKFLKNNKYPEGKITVVQNAIDTLFLREHYLNISDQEVQKLKADLNINSSRIGIYCGGMYPGKRLEFIIESCMRIKKEVPDFHMLFIGAGIDSFKVIDTEKNNKWIHYLGPKFGFDKVKYFKMASIQLMPSCLGLGILDSFAMETPIITTENSNHGPEIEYLENGINGIITTDSVEKYSEAVIKILNTDQYKELMEGCRKSSEIYTVENMVENFKTGIINCMTAKSLSSKNTLSYSLY
jgi:L-malate glycosyltransferase